MKAREQQGREKPTAATTPATANSALALRTPSNNRNSHRRRQIQAWLHQQPVLGRPRKLSWKIQDRPAPHHHSHTSPHQQV